MYTNRLNRIKEELNKPANEFDWSQVLGVHGDSEKMWIFFKDHVKLRRNIDSAPDLKQWCQTVYDQFVPAEHKSKRYYRKKEMSCQTAAKETNNPYAKMIVSMKKWIEREQLKGNNGNSDVIRWLEECR